MNVVYLLFVKMMISVNLKSTLNCLLITTVQILDEAMGDENFFLLNI